MNLATIESVEAEIMPTLEEAQESVSRAKGFLNGFWQEIKWQVQSKAWESLDYADFNAMWNAEYAAMGVGIERADRPGVVRVLHSEGQSQQEIADKLGVSQKTISNDVSNFTNVPATRPDSLGREQPTRRNTDNTEPQRDSMTVALINDLRGPWRRGITGTAKKMTQQERALLIDAIENTLNELKEI